MALTPDQMNQKITFDHFKEMAKNKKLSKAEKIGFPDSYRETYTNAIFLDIITKLQLERKNISVLDIGCGCGDLVSMFIEHAKKHGQKLYLLDSKEMLDNISDDLTSIFCIAGRFPQETMSFIQSNRSNIDVIIVYSVLQHVILEINPFCFIDKLITLLKPGGRLLLGDLPNISKRNRFFSSEAGIHYHQNFTKTKSLPKTTTLQLEEDKIDDGLIFGILSRYRGFGFEAYLLPQREDMPLYNRREDILLIRN